MTEIYRNDKYRFQIDVSLKWKLSTSELAARRLFIVTILAPDRKAKVTLCRLENPSLDTSANIKNITCDDIKALKDTFTKYEIISENPIIVRDLRGYSYLAQGAHLGREFYQRRTYFIKGKIIYWFVCDAKISDYNKYKDEFKTIIQSLSIDKKSK